MIAEGVHEADAIRWELGIAKTGTRFIYVNFRTINNEFAPWKGWLTESTIERTMDSLEYTGWDGASLSNPVGIGSQRCMIVVEHEYNDENGKTYPIVKWVNRLGGGGLKEENKLTGNDAADLDREFRASLLERRGKNGAPPPRASQQSRGNGFGPARSSYTDPAPPMGSPDDDDIPF